MTISYIIPVLDSHDIVRRQARHIERTCPADWQVLFIDDGSTPPINAAPFRAIPTNDFRPWTQPRARNIGAMHATGDYLLMADLDHVVTPQVVAACEAFAGSRLDFERRYGSLNDEGDICAIGQPIKPSPSACLVRRDLYLAIGGYDEAWCGRYGEFPGDDHDFNARWIAAHGRGERSEATLLVFPDSMDPTRFHALSRGRIRDRKRDLVYGARA